MSCCNTEVECSLRFCQSCVEERYVVVSSVYAVCWLMKKLVKCSYDFYFEADSRLFICPVCQGYCNCAPCLDKSKLIEKLHLAEIMDGSREEFHRILNKYKNVQTFLEAMGASRAPPVPRTIIHGIRIVRKPDDKQSRPIPQDVYHELSQPGRMEVTYRSMISLAGPITWAFPKASLNKKRKAARPEGDFENGAAEDSESDFDEVRRKRPKHNKKKSRHTALLANPAPSAIPFEFALDPSGQILFGNDGCPVINSIASPAGKETPSKRNGKKQVTFSTDLELPHYEGRYATQIQPQRLSAQAMQQAVQYIQQQLEQQQQQRANPEAHPDFQLDAALQEFFNEDSEAEEMARQIMDGSTLPSDEPIQIGTQTLAELEAAATSGDAQPNDSREAAVDEHVPIDEAVQNPLADPFTNSLNMDHNTFDSVIATVQQFQNVSSDNDLDAIFDVFPYNGADDGSDGRAYNAGDDGNDERNMDFDMEDVCASSGEV